MKLTVLGTFFGVILIHIVQVHAGGCNAWTGASAAASLDTNEHTTTDTGLAVAINDASYTTTCTCGIVTKWQFYARKNGTVVLYILRGTNTVVGSTSVNIPALSLDNYFEVPVSRDMWVSVKSSDFLGFFTSGAPMLTWNTATFTSSYSTGGSLTFTTNSVTNRQYAIGAYIEEGHEPMFLNLPYTTTLYSHQTGVIMTVQVTDLDPDDASSLTMGTSGMNTAYFSFDTATKVLRYSTAFTTGSSTFTFSITASDGCHSTVSVAVSVSIVNEPPRFLNLPFSTEVDEDATAAFTYTIQTSDPSSDTVTCSLSSVNPNASSIFSIVSNEIRQTASPNFDSDTATYYDLRISCSDTAGNAILSNYQFDIKKNEPPYYNPGTGFIPASVAVSSATGTNIYTVDATDPEGDTIAYALSCNGSCPFQFVGISAVIQTTAELTAEGYDVAITITDNKNSVGPYYLSVLVSVNPRSDAVNAPPIVSNLPATRHQMYVRENIANGTYMVKLTHTDQNPSDTYTYSVVSDSAANLFTFDTSTQIFTSGPAALDFESGSLPANIRFLIRVNDGTAAATASVTYTVRFIAENENETPTLAATQPHIVSDEGSVGLIFPDPGLAVTDVDVGDTHTWSMTCGSDSKYFSLDTMTQMISLAREYDMDSGLPGNATCVVTATDAGGLSASVTLTLSVININDNTPKFPYHVYTFVLSNTATFFTQITNLSASDGDSDSSGLSGGLTYSITTAGASTYFQIDSVGVLYVNDFSSLAPGDVTVFEVTATDSGTNPGPLTGTCTITVILSSIQVTTTTTTERNLVFTDDYLNPVWLLVFGLVMFAVIITAGYVVWNDPKFHEWKTMKMFRLSEICRVRPKEPKRGTVHPEKLTVTVNNKTLESDPDNAMPWELLAKDANVPEINEVQERIQKRKEKQDREYIKAGLPVFEKGKGPRPSSAGSRPDSESPKYATISERGNAGSSNKGNGGMSDMEEDEGGESQWGNLNDRRVVSHGSPTVVSPVEPEGAVGGTASNGGRRTNNSRRSNVTLKQLTDF